MKDGAARADDRREPVSRRNLLLFTIGAGLGLGGAACAEVTNGAQGFRVPTLDGEFFDASEHLGKHALLITFWTASCCPCLQQMPVFAELHRTYAARGSW